MPDQGDPIRGAEERFAEAVEPGRPSGMPADDPDLARDLEIAGMLRVLGTGFSPSADAKARMRVRVMGALAVDGPPSDGGGLTVGRPQENTSDGAPTEQLPVVAPAPVEDAAPTPLRVVPTAASDDTATEALGGADKHGTAVLAEPDLARAVRPRRRRRHALPSRPAARPAAPSLPRRVMAVGMAAAFAVLAIAGGSVFVSRDAVPGDALYGIKRAAEAAGGIFAAGDASRGQHDLDLAATRLDEIERMARDGVADPAVYAAAFQEFDNATRDGARGVLSGSDPGRSADDLADWATQQTARLAELRASLPSASQSAADDASRLLDQVHRRALALSARSGCSQVTSGATDDLGPLPAGGPCASARQATPGGSAPTDRARTAAPAGQEADQATAAGGQPQPDQDGGSDPGLVPGVQVGSGGDQRGAAPTTTTSPAPSANDQKNVNVPLPLPLPLTVPPLVPNKPGGLLG
jgi:Domain of unknown function (DUF5667)